MTVLEVNNVSIRYMTGDFKDIGLNHPFFSDIEWMAGKKITTGYSDGTFRPQNLVTREEACKVLCEALLFQL